MPSALGSSSQEGRGSWRRPRCFVLSPVRAVLIKMPGLRHWPCTGHLPEKPQPPPPAHKSDFSAPALSQQLKGRCINPSRGWKREENAKGPVQVPERFSTAGSQKPELPSPAPPDLAPSPAVGLPGTQEARDVGARIWGKQKEKQQTQGACLMRIYKDYVSCCGDPLYPHAQTTQVRSRASNPNAQRPECGRWAQGVLPVMKRPGQCLEMGQGCSLSSYGSFSPVSPVLEVPEQITHPF